MNQPLILALDIGTSSVRSALYDGGANQIRGTSIKKEWSFKTFREGGSHLDPVTAISIVAAAIDEALERSGKVKGEIGYVATCSFWHSLVGIDKKGDPTTKIIGWADTRSRNYSGLLKKRFDERETHDRTGARFHSSFWPAKLLWLRKECPEIFAKTERWLSFTDLIGLTFFGEAATSVSMASGTGIFDIRKCEWDAELLKYLKISPAMLPAVAAQQQTFKLNKKYAKRWPRLAGAKWLPAIGDGAADSMGAGCVTKGKAALMVGTSGAMRVAYAGETPATIPDGLWCYRIDRKRVIIGGALSDGGNLYAWMRQNLSLPKDAEKKVAIRPPGARGVTILPYFHGERSTGYDESANGALFGLTAADDAVDIFQAAMEAVAYRFAEILKQLNSVVKVKEIVASGGALRDSPVWTQIIADVLGRDLVVNNAKESSSRGAVLLALESIGKIEGIEIESKPAVRLIKANKNRTEQYRKSRDRHAGAYDLLKR